MDIFINLLKELFPLITIGGFIFTFLKFRGDKEKDRNDKEKERIEKAVESQKQKSQIENLEKDVRFLYEENNKISSIEKQIIELSLEFKNIASQLISIATDLKKHIEKEEK